MAYDRELGTISSADERNARELLEDLMVADDSGLILKSTTEWLRKFRYEAVLADRLRRTS